MSNVSQFPGKPGPPHVEQLRLDYEAEYMKFNEGALSVMPTDKLVALQAQHFQQATIQISNGNMLLKHVGIISKILLGRKAKG